MVGRGGRSKGCINCRRRKKGCDLARPSCGQCSKSNVKCEGYNTELEILAYRYKPTASTSCKSLQSNSMKINYADTFWELFLPSVSQASQTANASWTRIIRDRYNAETGPFKNALLAVTLSRVGQYNNDLSITRSGDNYYSQCLRQVIRAINENNEASSDETIATCLVLSLYEILCSPVSADGWLNHMQGLATLIQLRGPQAFTSGIRHKLFASARLELIYASIATRKATFLDSPEWISIPWTNTPPKSFYDKIIDLNAQIPRILETVDKTTHSANPHQPRDWERILSACWGLDSALQDWGRAFHPIYTPSSSTSTTFDPSKPSFTTPLTSASQLPYAHAQSLATYWATCLFLHATMQRIWQATASPAYLLPPRIDPHPYAVTIALSIPYFCGPTAGEASSIFYSMSVSAALHYLSACGEAGTPIYRRLTDAINPQGGGDLRYIRARMGIFLKGLAVRSVSSPAAVRGAGEEGGKVVDKKEEEEEIVELAQQWWGGGKEAVVLPSAR